jgi:hypothetical protein
VAGKDRESPLPVSESSKNGPAPRQIATAPPVLGTGPQKNLEQEPRQGQAQLLTPPDSDSH